MKTAFYTLFAMCVVVNLAKAEMPVDPTAEASINSVEETPIVSVGQMYASMVVTTVEGASTMPDEAFVLLTGKIIKDLGDKKFTFKDDTGEVMVEIDEKYLEGKDITPESTVEIIGAINKKQPEQIKIEVRSLSLR